MESNILQLKLIQAFKSASKEHVVELINSNAQYIKLEKSQGPLLSSDLHVLHIAVQAASLDTIRNVLVRFKDAPALDINSVEATRGDTPLHIAARYGRSDIVMYLLSLEDINDTVTNFAGKQPVEVAKTPELAEAMQVVRAQYVENVAIKMKQYFCANNIPALGELLSGPRASALLDINGQDPDTGSTVLHDFVKSRNIPMVEFILAHGADPFRRNSLGVLPIDTTKDETIKKLLKQSTKSQTVVIQPAGSVQITLGGPSVNTTGIPPGDPATYYPNDEELPHMAGPAPSMKGFLKKWTNFTGGYKLRWFVLENGVLSYYKKQGYTESACRGAINMKQAKLHLDSTEQLQFEVISRDSSKFHLKANHPVETSRWVWALTNAIQYAKDQDKLKSLQGQASNRYAKPTSSPSTVKPSGVGANLAVGTGAEPIPRNSGSSLHLARQMTTRSASTHVSRPSGSNSRGNKEETEGGVYNDNVAKLVSLNNNEASRGDENYQSEYDDEDYDDDGWLHAKNPPHTYEVSSCLDSIKIGLTSVESTIKSLRTSNEASDLSREDLDNGLTTLDHAMGMINTLMTQYTQQIRDRESFYKRRIERDEELELLWTTTIRDMELEKDKIEGHLHRARQKRKEASKALRDVTGSPAGSRTGQKSITTTDIPEVADIIGYDQATEANTELISKEGFDSEEDSDDEFFDALGAGSANEVKNEQGNNIDCALPEVNVHSSETGNKKDDENHAEKIALTNGDNVLLHEDPNVLTDAQRTILNSILSDNSFAGRRSQAV